MVLEKFTSRIIKIIHKLVSLIDKIKDSLFGNNKKHWLHFIIRVVVFFAFAFIFYKLLRKIEFIDTLYVDTLNIFASFLLETSKFIVNLFGYEAVTYGKTIKIIDDLTTMGVYLDRGCMGRNVMLTFAGLIAVFPGSWKHKLWYIPAGTVVLIILNIFRISALTIIAHCCPEYSDVNHYIIFKYTAWVFIFIMWVIWLNKFSPFSKKAKSNQKEISSS